MDIQKNLTYIRSILPDQITLLAISKTQKPEVILEAYHSGQRAFGENKAQELSLKYPVLPKDIEWHFVGHLQSNKIKTILPFVSLIQSIDSVKLLQVIDAESLKINKITNCLLQFHIASEETKYGFDLAEAVALFSSGVLTDLKNIRIRGVMGMATFTKDKEQVRKEFRSLKNIFDLLKKNYFPTQESFSILSMGMSEDYQVAIEEGSTLIRIGTSIFGNRISQ